MSKVVESPLVLLLEVIGRRRLLHGATAAVGVGADTVALAVDGREALEYTIALVESTRSARAVG